jgi:predicted lipid-binding transport protein (Tim44 family)
MQTMEPANLLARAGGGQNFHTGGGGTGGGGGGGGIGGGGGHFLFFGGGGGGGGSVLGVIFLVVVVVVIIAVVMAAQRRRMGGEPLMPPHPYPHSDAPAMPGTPPWLAGGPGGAGQAAPAAAPPVEDGMAAIKAHDPDFDEDRFLADVQRSFFTVEEAWTELEPDMSRQVMADGLWQQHKVQIENYQRNGTRNVLDGLAVGKVTVLGASSDQTFDTITVRILAACADYDVATADGKDGKVVRGNKHDMSQFEEDWIFQRSAKATTKGAGGTMQKKCPNCGAPLDVDLAGICKFCRAPVMSGDYDWVLTRIDQVGV